jgi:putative transposase
MALVRKSIKQRYRPSVQLLSVMESFRQMTNDCIRAGLDFGLQTNNAVPSRKTLSYLCYGQLRKRYGGYSQYAICAISRAAGILSARRKSITRGFRTKAPYASKAVLVSCYGFKIEDECLVIHLDGKSLESIPLNSHTRAFLSDPTLKIRSFTLTEESVSICVCKDIKIEDPRLKPTIGVDRNLGNLTVGNAEIVTYYDVSELTRIAEMTREVAKSFRRPDRRIRQRIAAKYGRRRGRRTAQLLNRLSREVVEDAKHRGQAIIFEEVTGIRKLYQRGNKQGKLFRFKMNSWPFAEIKKQIEYKAAWEGVPVVTLTKRETRGTTMDCPRCGERLQVPIRGDSGHHRQLWCKVCEKWRDRDLVAVLNISHRGWLRFDHSQGETRETMKGNPNERQGSSQEPVILRVDASKLRIKLKTQ